MRNRKALCLLCAFTMLAATGCSEEPIINTQTEQVEISFSWWGNDKRNIYTIKAIEEFEELYPNIKVDCDYSEWSGYETRSKIRMISNTESDVMQINYAWLSQYSPDGSGYYDLEKLSDTIDFSNFDEDILEYGRQNGVLNAVPIAMNTETVFINKTVYDSYGLDIPQTWEDLFSAAQAMNGEVYPLAMQDKAAFLCIMAYAEQQSGKSFFDEDNNLEFGAEEIALMLDFYCSLVNNNVTPQWEYFNRLNMADGTYGGTVAWVSDAESYCGTAIENGYEMVAADYLTVNPSDTVSGWYAKPATMYAISKNTDHPEEAALLFNYLLNSSEMAELQGIEKGIPLSKSALSYLEDSDLLTGIQYEAYLRMEENMDSLKHISPYTEKTDILDLFKESFNEVLYEKNDVYLEAERLYEAIKDTLGNDS